MRIPVPSRWLVALALGAAAPTALAQESTPALPWKQGGVYLGGYLTRFDSTVRLGSDAVGLGLEVNLEDAVGLDAATQDIRLGAYWRFGETSRHKVKLDYFSSSRTASRILQEDVTVNDTTYPAGTELALDSSFGIIRATYGYSFLLDDRIDLSASAGLYTMPFSFDFEGISSNESQDFTAPLPVLGLHADIALTPDLFLKQGVDLFYLEYGDFRGSLTDVYLGVEWYPWERFGLGLGYESLRIAIEADGQEIDLEGNVKYGQNGLFLYITYAF